MALKETQGLFNVSGRPRTIPQYGCIVMEVEDWIDGIVSISSHPLEDITLLQEEIANMMVESTGVGS
jgi:hypothetical protein